MWCLVKSWRGEWRCALEIDYGAKWMPIDCRAEEKVREEVVDRGRRLVV